MQTETARHSVTTMTEPTPEGQDASDDPLPRNEAELRRPHSTDDDPFRIATLLNSRAVGDTIFFHVFAASVKLLFDQGRLLLYQRNDRPYKKDLLDLNPHKDSWLVLGQNGPKISIDNFGVITDILANNEPIPPYFFLDGGWGGRNWNEPHLILSPSNMPERNLPSFENPAFLRVPDDRVGPLTDELVAHGVDPGRWFCCLNYREPGYAYRPDRLLRDLDARPFQQLTDYIIGQLGGQVVRVGHPQMTPFKKQPGFVDLAMVDNAFMLHAFAVSRARFLVGSLTGISHIGSAFNTPTLITNNSDPMHFPGCWRPHDLALYINVYRPSGKRVSLAEQHQSGFHNRKFLISLINDRGFRMAQNQAPELAAAVRIMMEQTTDCQGWREPTPQPSGEPRPNRFSVPMERRIRTQFCEFPDLAPKL